MTHDPGATTVVTVTLHIRRSGGAHAEFTAEAGPHTTIMDALEQVRGEQDGTLLYRHSCHHGSCGTCGVIANGRRVLACTTRVRDLQSPIVLEPLSPYPVIGDLAVDPTSLYRDFPAAAGILRESEAVPDAVVPPEITASRQGHEPAVREKHPGRENQGFARFENCIECGLCESACPVVSAPGREVSAPGREVSAPGRPFKGPAALAAYGRELEKHPERADELLAEVDTPDGVWACDRALQCSMVCPMQVYPARHIAVLQRRVRERNR